MIEGILYFVFGLLCGWSLYYVLIGREQEKLNGDMLRFINVTLTNMKQVHNEYLLAFERYRRKVEELVTADGIEEDEELN